MTLEERLTIENIEAAIQRTAGNVSLAAHSLGVSRMTLYRRINKSERLKNAVEDAREKMVDEAETALRHLISEGNVAAIIFALKTIGKNRGYVERQELTGKDGGPIDLRWFDGSEVE